MATLIPTTGSFSEYAARFVDPALGFACAWAYWFQWAIALPIEVQAAGEFIHFWFPDLEDWYIYTAILILLIVINLFAVRNYGEVEFFLSMFKVSAIMFFIVCAFFIVIKDGLGFSNYYHEAAALSKGKEWGVVATMIHAAFGLGGTELIGITAGEVENPKKNVPKAIKGAFIRVFLFYLVSIFMLGLVLNPDYIAELNKNLNRVAASPFSATIKMAGISWAADFINAVALIAVLSAGNSSIYAR